MAQEAASLPHSHDEFSTEVTDRILDVYARADNPEDPLSLRDLWIGRAEHELGPYCQRAALAERWRATSHRRSVHPDEVLNSRVTVRFIKELFNWYFREDLYGELRPTAKIILSGGSVDEEAWGLPAALKDCIRFALDRDWYGYSDSRGRVPVREAVAWYENARIDSAPYTSRNVALTMGGTFTMNSLCDFILYGATLTSSPALCAVPNYPPLVEAVARRRGVRLIPLPSEHGRTSLRPLIKALRPTTPLVMLQTVGNPTGAAVTEEELAALIGAAAPNTMIILDECHEWLGDTRQFDRARAAANVIRVSSLSKNWSAPGVKMGWILADDRFIDEYYEYASTSFGGPPSFFYTLIEVLARMERWMITSTQVLNISHLHEFEDAYQLDLPRLQAAYDTYRHERRARERALLVLRDAAVVGFGRATGTVVRPRYSINMAVRFDRWADSYLCFRGIVRETGVSVLPGILTFCFSGDVVRVTTARQWDDLSAAITRLTEHFSAAGAPPAAGRTSPAIRSLAMSQFRVTRGRKLVLGMIHLAPLPGTPFFVPGSLRETIDTAVSSAAALYQNGADGCLLQTVDRVYSVADESDPARVAAMALTTRAIVEATGETFQIGVHMLRNALSASLAVAKVAGGSYIRAGAIVGQTLTAHGMVSASPLDTMAYRAKIDAQSIAIIADVESMHFHWPDGEKTVPQVAAAAMNVGADAIAISHPDEARAIDMVDSVRKALPDVPIILAGETRHENAARLLRHADGAFVGRCLEKGGWGGAIDPGRVRDYIDIARSTEAS